VHLVLRARQRRAFQGFLRSFAGIVARRVTGARRGRPSGKFFSGLAWTRIVSWGRDYWGVRHYVFRNEIEGELGSGIRRALEEGPGGSRRLRSRARADPASARTDECQRPRHRADALEFGSRSDR
jgi:hypothetical protein